jgi:hypothetical protein
MPVWTQHIKGFMVGVLERKQLAEIVVATHGKLEVDIQYFAHTPFSTRGNGSEHWRRSGGRC